MSTWRVSSIAALRISALACAIWLGGCATDNRAPGSGGRFLPGDGLPAAAPVDVANVPDAIPASEPLSKTGNHPYQVFGKTYVPLRSSKGYWAEGYASWYGTKFHGRRTSSGEPYDMYSMSAAHRTLPLPSYLRVTNLANRRSVVVKVNDRGPFVDPTRRVIDLSYAAAVRLDMIAGGTARVRIEAVQPAGATASAPVAARAASAGAAPARAAPARAAPPIETSPEYASFLQIGAFSDRGNAQLLQQRIMEVGVSAYVEQAGELFKVKAGPYRDADSALNHKLELDRLLDIEAMVVFE